MNIEELQTPNYYHSRLKTYLELTYHEDQFDDIKIAAKAVMAARIFCENYNGQNPNVALDKANLFLYEDCHCSKREIVRNILDVYFYVDDNMMEIAMHNATHLVEHIIDKYDITDNFSNTIEFDTLCDEIRDYLEKYVYTNPRGIVCLYDTLEE